MMEILFKNAGGFVAGLLGACLIFGVYHSFGQQKMQKIATVDISGIIGEFAQHEALQNFPPEKVRADIIHFGRSIEMGIKRFAKSHHVILLPKEAVIAGAVDYTNVFRNEMAVYRENPGRNA